MTDKMWILASQLSTVILAPILAWIVSRVDSTTSRMRLAESQLKRLEVIDKLITIKRAEPSLAANSSLERLSAELTEIIGNVGGAAERSNGFTDSTVIERWLLLYPMQCKFASVCRLMFLYSTAVAICGVVDLLMGLILRARVETDQK